MTFKKFYKEKFKCQSSERKFKKIPNDASLSAFIRPKDLFQVGGKA